MASEGLPLELKSVPADRSLSDHRGSWFVADTGLGAALLL
jgi:hypothetical protein